MTALPYGRLTAPTVLSGVLAATAATTCTLLLFVPDVLTGTAVMNGSARGTALVALVVGVPLLVAGMVLTRRGSVRALPVWLGAQAYLLYNSVLFAFATPFDDLFVPIVATLGLSLWSLVVTLGSVDVRRFAALVGEDAPVRAVAGYVGVIVGLNTLAWLAPVLRATFADGPAAFLAGTGLTTNPVYVQDLAFWLPALGLGAVLLWRRVAWGYLIVTAGLSFWVVEGFGVASDQWFGHAADPSSSVASAAATPAFAVLGLVSLVPLTAMLRRLTAGAGDGGARPAPGALPFPPSGRALVGVQAIVGLTAVLGGVQLVANGFGMPTAWLARAGVQSWVLPGIALLVAVAAPQLGSAAAVATSHRWAGPAAWVSSVGLVLWIVAETAVLQQYSVLQPLVAALGLAEVALVAAWRRTGRAGPTALPLEAATDERGADIRTYVRRSP